MKKKHRSDFKRIAVIGNAGAGKSNFSLRLHQILQLPLYHLDQYFWKPGWKEPDRSEFEKIHKQLCDTDTWIIDGMGLRFLSYRARRADVVIFLDVPRHTCFFRVFRRALTNFGKVYFSSAKGCQERGPDCKFLRYIWSFNKKRVPHIYDAMCSHADTTEFIVIKNDRELQELIERFKSK
ncbi:hypothetical protein JW872_04070 [Candidatus Babeliales bacterium]|nr:hypothetical protein [Candidatus Babeliales bacterium]